MSEKSEDNTKENDNRSENELLLTKINPIPESDTTYHRVNDFQSMKERKEK